MLLRRVIPCLDVANGRVVKGTRFLDLVDEGDPAELAARYAAAGADELVFLDITAAPEDRGTLLDVVERTARRVFVPLTVGGGVRSSSDMKAVLRAGADKVGVNTAAVRDPDLIARCARRFGRQCVVVSIDARARARSGTGWIDQANGELDGAATDRPVASQAAGTDEIEAAGNGWEVVVRGGREPTGIDAVEWAQHVVDLGAGEILLTSIDRDGTRSGFDLDLLRAVTSRVGVPVIASGGAGTPRDMVAAITIGGADAVLAASIFHRDLHSIAAVKAALAAEGVPVRQVAATA
jgi:cyclase